MAFPSGARSPGTGPRPGGTGPRSGGTGSGGTGHSDSPGIRSGSLLVTSTRTSGQLARIWSASAAAAATMCSQLSRISRSCRSASAATSRSAGSASEPSWPAPACAITGLSLMPSALITAEGTSPGSVTGVSSTNHTWQPAHACPGPSSWLPCRGFPGQPGRCLQGQPRLACPAGAGQGDQPALVQHLQHPRDILVPADEAGQRSAHGGGRPRCGGSPPARSSAAEASPGARAGLPSGAWPGAAPGRSCRSTPR